MCNYPGFSQTPEKSQLIALGLSLHFHKFFVNFSWETVIAVGLKVPIVFNNVKKSFVKPKPIQQSWNQSFCRFMCSYSQVKLSVIHPNPSMPLFSWFWYKVFPPPQSKSKSGSVWCTTLSLKDMNWVCFIGQFGLMRRYKSNSTAKTKNSWHGTN